MSRSHSLLRTRIYALEACESVPVPKDGQMLGMRMMGITFSDTKNIDAKTQKVLRESGLTELSFQTNLAYTPEVQSSILMENLPMYGGMVLVFLAINVVEYPFAKDEFTDVNPMIVGISPLLVPIFDVAREFCRRLRRHRNPFMPDRCHIHHKLLALGLSPAAALTVILSFAMLLLAINLILSAMVDINLLVLLDITIWIAVNVALTQMIRKREKRLGYSLYE